jgi:ribosomal protein S18 acetylase RimI-like enzyme
MRYSRWAVGRGREIHSSMPNLREYNDATDRQQVISLWRAVFGYETAHNAPSLAIVKKLDANDGLFFVAQDKGRLAGTSMAGYDGHRGWLYAIAVHPDHRRAGIGARLVRHAEQVLIARGCMKVNLQLLATNEPTAAFYKALGYAVEPRISMGKVFPENVPAQRGA